MTYPWPSCGARNTICRAQSKMKIQGHLSRKQDKNVFFPSAVSQFDKSWWIFVVFILPLHVTLPWTQTHLQGIMSAWVLSFWLGGHRCPKLTFSMPRPLTVMEGNIRGTVSREPNPGRRKAARRWDFTWAKAQSPQCVLHHPVRHDL